LPHLTAVRSLPYSAHCLSRRWPGNEPERSTMQTPSPRHGMRLGPPFSFGHPVSGRLLRFCVCYLKSGIGHLVPVAKQDSHRVIPMRSFCLSSVTACHKAGVSCAAEQLMQSLASNLLDLMHLQAWRHALQGCSEWSEQLKNNRLVCVNKEHSASIRALARRSRPTRQDLLPVRSAVVN